MEKEQKTTLVRCGCIGCLTDDCEHWDKDCSLTTMQECLIGRTNFVCDVPFCRGFCQRVPEGVEIKRASCFVNCDVCNRQLRTHVKFCYPSGMGHVVQDCKGNFWHL